MRKEMKEKKKRTRENHADEKDHEEHEVNDHITGWMAGERSEETYEQTTGHAAHRYR